MKLNLFSGMFVFEGTINQFNHVLKSMPEMNNKMEEIQTTINNVTLDFQKRQNELPKANKSSPGLSS